MFMSKIHSLFALTLLTAGLVAAPLSAQTLQQRQQRTADETRFASAEVAPTAQRCGRDLPVSFAWDSFNAEQTADGRAASLCAEAYRALRTVCDSDAGRQAVAEKISGVMCTAGAARALALNNGKLEFTIDFNAANNAEVIATWLGEHL